MDFITNCVADRSADHTSREGFSYGIDGTKHSIAVAIAPALLAAPAAEVADVHTLPETHALRSPSKSASASANPGSNSGNAHSRGEKTYWATLARSGGSENGSDSSHGFSSGIGDPPAKKRTVAASLVNPTTHGWRMGGLLGGVFKNDVELNVNTLLESEIVLAAAIALITATLLLLLRPPIVKSKGEAERRLSLLRVVGISLLTALCALVYLVVIGHTAIQTKK